MSSQEEGPWRRTLVAALAAAAIGGLPATAPARSSDAPHAVIAKTCWAGYKHAVLGRDHKCLRAGQYCAKRYERKYRRKGFTCRWYKGVYRLRYR